RCNADHHGVALVGGAQGPSASREMHHLAFEVATLDEVVRARAHLERHGVKIEFHDPDNHFLEIFWGLDQVGTDGRIRPPEEWREELSLEDAIANPPSGQDTTLHGAAPA